MSRSGWRRLHIALATAAVVVLACLIANFIPLNEYVLSADKPRSVAALVSSPGGHLHQVFGRVLLTSVHDTRISAFGYLFYDTFGHVRVLPAETVLGPSVPPSELAAESDAELAESVADAKAAAFRQLGYPVIGRDVGVLVLAVAPGSPAWSHLRPGEIITKVDGVATSDGCAFTRALARRRPGTDVQLSVERSTVTRQGEIVPGPTEPVRLRLTRTRMPVHVSSSPACPHNAGASRGGSLGIAGHTQETFTLPFAVAVHGTGAQRTSGGLAMALGIVDLLAGGDLTGGRTVAATGSLLATGRVGQVKGVADSAWAAWLDGATTFFAPSAQVKTARLVVPPTLRVVGVASLTQATAALLRLGGKLTAARHARG